MATNIIIETTSASGKKLQKAIANVNPNATNYELKVFAQSLNSLTSNTYVGTTRIDRVDISDARSPRDPHFTITPAAIRLGTFNEEPYKVTCTLDYLGDDRTATYSGTIPTDGENTPLPVDVKAKQIVFDLTQIDGDVVCGQDTLVLTFTLPATEDYDAATATVTFTSADATHSKTV